MARFNTLRVKSGFNQALTDSDNIEGFTPTGSPKTVSITRAGAVYCFVDGDPKDYSRGQARFDFSTAKSFVGFKRVVYNQPMMHVDTLAWLQTNYEGAVSANLRTDKTSYLDWNAYLRFEIVERIGRNWRSVDWVFQLIEEIV